MSKSIRQATVSGLRWGTALQLAQSGFSVLATIVLARLLERGDFGLVALVNAILMLLSALVGLGFGAALIQKRTIDSTDIATAFFTNVTLGLLAALLVVGAAPWIAGFWNMPDLIPVLMVSSSVLFIRAVAATPVALLERDLQFRTLAHVTIVATLTGTAAKIALAWTGWGVWSLVAGEILTQTLIAGRLCVTFHDHLRPSFASAERFVELFRFGRSIALSNLLNSASSHIDVLVIGRFLSAGSLGSYTMALAISTSASSASSLIIQRVAFPAFSRVQHDEARLRSGYLEALQYSSLAILAPTIGLGLVAGEFVHVFLSAKWAESVPAIRILTIYAAMNSLGGALWAQVLKARGKVELLLGMTIVRVVALPLAVIAGAPWGLIGICAGVAAYAVIFRFVYQIIVNRYAGIGMREFFAAVEPALVASAVMAGCVLLVAGALRATGLPLQVALGVETITGAVAYVGAAFLLHRQVVMGLWNAVAGSGGRSRPRQDEQGAVRR